MEAQKEELNDFLVIEKRKSKRRSSLAAGEILKLCTTDPSGCEKLFQIYFIFLFF